MGILPEINFVDYSKDTNIQEKQTNRKTFLIDFQKGKMLRQNGKLIKTDDERSVRMWIEKVLLTEKYKFNIYKENGKNQYGMQYKAMISGQRFPTPILYSEFVRELEETVLKNKQIKEIKDIDVKLVRHTLETKFTVVLQDFHEFEWEGYL
ncbi:hypothetical protein A2U10_07225 [Fusobacterium necrophorum subsp. funduliforme]|jgi:hypothetical protein|uniref:DUF2634 domain-containing protein n=1 Tax=Fusobacterium necrophorum TaxID=859 RepID=UPI000787AC91|nr:DUF2634 domain-containing protein [Fusobacterium necrophorum]KYM38518.1 hypothetical protein A2U10_07225 [Fusobacterium necrophorum subsp. funduliforme]